MNVHVHRQSLMSHLTHKRDEFSETNLSRQYESYGSSTDLYYFIQIPCHLFESYVHHVAADKLVNIPTKMAASSIEWC